MNRIAASPMRLARSAGLLYLVVGIFAAFSYDYVTATLYAPGDAGATTRNVVANAELVRVGVVADLVYATAWIFLALAVYRLLRDASEDVARAMVVLVAVGAAIVCVAGVLPAAALSVASGGAYATALGAAGTSAIVLLLFDVHHVGYLASSVFFGLWLAPLGYLAWASGLFPRALGVALVAAAACYLVNAFAAILVPGMGARIESIVSVVPVVAEVWMLGYLLVKGARSAPPNTRPGAADAAPVPA